MKSAILAAALGVLASPLRAQTSSDSIWFRSQFAQIDLTGDGRPDTLILRATGKRIDGLVVDLRIRSRGRLLFRDSWSSASYFQYDAPLDSIPDATKREKVLHHLREVLVASAFAPFAPGGEPGPDIGTMSSYLALQIATDSLRRIGVGGDSLLRTSHRVARQMTPDTALLQRAWSALVSRRPRTFTYFSGGESTQVIVWSAVLGRFVTVFACC